MQQRLLRARHRAGGCAGGCAWRFDCGEERWGAVGCGGVRWVEVAGLAVLGLWYLVGVVVLHVVSPLLLLAHAEDVTVGRRDAHLQAATTTVSGGAVAGAWLLMGELGGLGLRGAALLASRGAAGVARRGAAGADAAELDGARGTTGGWGCATLPLPLTLASTLSLTLTLNLTPNLPLARAHLHNVPRDVEPLGAGDVEEVDRREAARQALHRDVERELNVVLGVQVEHELRAHCRREVCGGVAVHQERGAHDAHQRHHAAERVALGQLLGHAAVEVCLA
eukprot:scaffold12339_cov53-Phaeocystis_antarctica.AAC.2